MNLEQLRPYPVGMCEIPIAPHGSIAERAFFPGGCGYINEEARLWSGPRLIIVGNDFGRFEQDYVHAVVNGQEDLAGTWAGILDVLRRAGVDERSCFFTNAIMGARISESNTGPSPGLKDVGFRNRCASFLSEQVRARNARGVAMVGKEQRAVVAAAFPNLAALATCETWADIDGRNLQFHANVTNPSGGSFHFCSLMHPSLRASNMAQRGRVFEEYRDDRAEIEMLRRVMVL